MLHSRGVGRLMNPRRITLTLGTAAGTAVAAALIGLANAPAATADTDLDPFQDLFDNTGFNPWTPTADTDLGVGRRLGHERRQLRRVCAEYMG